ncbi:MAG: ketopantoate reductase family protein [Candidatus Fermentibacteraceae bacterium]|nr:ketopantoate reductase family protein [Candidatus Fermentibacteraceae bacterium]MBN2608742.1 ketopantoate reductase family protein [Candidatus Fermentibacteraceae bacterium]
MPGNNRLAIWGDGAVGTGLAVALSPFGRVLLVGPPGSGRGRITFESLGAFPGSAEVEKVECGDLIAAELCLIAVKAYDLAEVSGPAARCTDGACICVSNGMGLERAWGDSWKSRVEPAILTAGFGPGPEPGRSVMTTFGDVIVSADGSAGGLFGKSPIPVRFTDSMEMLRWGKWLVNSVINPLGAISGLPNDRLLGAGLEDAIEILFEELLPVVPDEYRSSAGSEALSMMTRLLGSSSNRCSMLQDIDAGRRTEIDFMTGMCIEFSGGRCPASACVTGLLKALSKVV